MFQSANLAGHSAATFHLMEVLRPSGLSIRVHLVRARRDSAHPVLPSLDLKRPTRYQLRQRCPRWEATGGQLAGHQGGAERASAVQYVRRRKLDGGPDQRNHEKPILEIHPYRAYLG